MEYFYTARFLRSLKKYDETIQDDIVVAVKLFEKGKNDKELKLHKLHGKFSGYFAFSANFTHRIIIKKEKGTVYYLDVGTHDMYR
jgi:mRNA-degrading endonuclease YafQ of YafQ-DinJ toxin-antitoxin module